MAPQVLEVLRNKGVTLKPFNLSYGVQTEDIIMTIMIAEAAAHFDYWQRSGQDAQNRRQDYWPPLLRLARLIPAVEYIQVRFWLSRRCCDPSQQAGRRRRVGLRISLRQAKPDGRSVVLRADCAYF